MHSVIIYSQLQRFGKEILSLNYQYVRQFAPHKMTVKIPSTTRRQMYQVCMTFLFL